MGRGESKYITMALGGQFAMIPGISTTRKSCVARLAILTHPMLHGLPISVKEVARYGWMMSTAKVMKVL